MQAVGLYINPFWLGLPFYAEPAAQLGTPSGAENGTHAAFGRETRTQIRRDSELPQWRYAP
jgi:hypothetical protein